MMRSNATPFNLFNLYGDEGDKFVAAGLFLRRAKGWTMLGGSVPDGDLAYKVAALEAKNLALLRGQIEGLCVPLACTVDHSGVRFFVCSLAPLSTNSLVYGTDTEGLLFEDAHEAGSADTLEVARKIAAFCNIKVHTMTERGTGKTKRMLLPLGV